MKRAAFAVLLLCVALVAGALADTEETAISEDPPLPGAEYITGTAIQPVSGADTTQKDPFKPYDIGDPASAVPYEALNPDEQALADRNRDKTEQYRFMPRCSYPAGSSDSRERS